jgi:hypothetical protein
MPENGGRKIKRLINMIENNYTILLDSYIAAKPISDLASALSNIVFTAVYSSITE